MSRNHSRPGPSYKPKAHRTDGSPHTVQTIKSRKDKRHAKNRVAKMSRKGNRA